MVPHNSGSDITGAAPARLPSWLRCTELGLWCAENDFFVDPTGPVDRAVITHGHTDHARAGHGAVLATAETCAIIGERYGSDAAGSVQALAYGETARLGTVTVTLVPSGHILGAAQVVLSRGGERVVFTGDFKRRSDATCTPFEVVPCDVFITEATFGLPVFRHPEDADEVAKLLASLALFPDRPHLIGVYALGKCQRLITLLRRAGYDRPIWLHGALLGLCRLYTTAGIDLGDLRPVANANRKLLAGEIVLCPPSATADRWARAFPDPVIGLASGWMLIRQRAKKRGVELPLVISDHADWTELTATIQDVNAATVFVTHGREDALVHWATAQRYAAAPLSIAGYEGDER